MNTSIIYCGIFFLLLLSCNEKAHHNVAAVDVEIASLKTSAEKRAFLEEIYELDQTVRHKLNEQSLKFGYDSEEVKLTSQEMLSIDNTNLRKLEKYLEVYPYPAKSELGETAAGAPWLVIHHNGPLAKRNQYFSLLYEAYLDENIDDGQMSLYLERSYVMRHEERLKMKGPYKSEDQINLLIKGLDLQEEQAEILKKRNTK